MKILSSDCNMLRDAKPFFCGDCAMTGKETQSAATAQKTPVCGNHGTNPGVCVLGIFNLQDALTKRLKKKMIESIANVDN